MKTINWLLGVTGIGLIVAGFLLYHYDSPSYKFADFLSKYVTAAGIFVAILAYFATTHKDKEDGYRAMSTIGFNLINQWQVPPFADYRKDIFAMEKVDALTKGLIEKENAGDFASILAGANYAHYRSSLFCILNFFEHIALSIERRVADEEYLRDFFKSIIIDYQDTYRFYIAYERRKEPELWIKFSNLAENWKE
jgi:hypothetical protein